MVVTYYFVINPKFRNISKMPFMYQQLDYDMQFKSELSNLCFLV